MDAEAAMLLEYTNPCRYTYLNCYSFKGTRAKVVGTGNIISM